MTAPVLAIDTATRVAVVGLSAPDDPAVVAVADAWLAGYRHGEELLARIEGVLERAGLAQEAIGGIVVGTGPGAFTGLRVGIATAKGLAHALRIPIVGVATSEALLAAAGGGADVLLLPAGPSDRVVCRAGERAAILPGGEEPELRAGEGLVAVDLPGRAPDDAVARGERARDGLLGALLGLGGPRMAGGDADDLAALVPEYVTLPRGIRDPAPDGGVVLSSARTGAASGTAGPARRGTAGASR